MKTEQNGAAVVVLITAVAATTTAVFHDEKSLKRDWPSSILSFGSLQCMHHANVGANEDTAAVHLLHLLLLFFVF